MGGACSTNEGNENGLQSFCKEIRRANQASDALRWT